MVHPRCPGRADLAHAHDVFREHESRDLFYRPAIALLRLAKAGMVDLTVGEALAVLLRTWNSAHYRYHPPGTGHYAEVEALIEMHGAWLESVTHRGIASFTDLDEQPLRTVFTGFEMALGPVGAAKALHLLAPCFMPLWDARSRPNTPEGLVGQARMRGVTSGSCRQPGNRASRRAVTPERPDGTS
jgi:hypothetical protein